MSVDNLDPPIHNINSKDKTKRKENFPLTHKLISHSFRPCGKRELIPHSKKESKKFPTRNIINLPLSSTRKENPLPRFGRFPGTEDFLTTNISETASEIRESEVVDDNLLRNNPDSRDSRDSRISNSDSCDSDSDSCDSHISDSDSCDSDSLISESDEYEESPTSKDKWMAAFTAGVLFALISSPLAYYITSSITVGLGGIALTVGPGPTFAGLLLHTIIFILIIRWILN